MFLIISGAASIAVSCASFLYLLPRNGQVHRLVRNSDVGSMVTITIMGVLSFGIAMLVEGLAG